MFDNLKYVSFDRFDWAKADALTLPLKDYPSTRAQHDEAVEHLLSQISAEVAELAVDKQVECLHRLLKCVEVA